MVAAGHLNDQIDLCCPAFSLLIAYLSVQKHHVVVSVKASDPLTVCRTLDNRLASADRDLLNDW